MRDYSNHAYIDNLKSFSLCGKIIGFEGSVSEYKLPSPIKETYGEHDYKRCENCQKCLKDIEQKLTNKYKGYGDELGFPHCCAYHMNLITEVKEFKKESFDNVPKMTAFKVIITYQHIYNQRKKENWKVEISDYLEYVIESFGKMPANCGMPLFLENFFDFLKPLVNHPKDLDQKIKTFINDYIEDYYNAESFSFSKIAETYDRWLNLFPFDLSLFSGLKDQYKKLPPLSSQKPRKNKYTGLTKGKFISLDELNQLLNITTNKLITDINSISLYEKGQLSEPDKLKLEFVLESRKKKLKQGYINKNLPDYYKMIEDWMEDEKKFLTEISSIITKNQPENKLTQIWMDNPNMSIEDVLKKGYDLGIWDSKNRITSQKNSLYGTGKTLLASLYIALKGSSIKENIDYKVVGQLLCDFFEVPISETTKEPYKSFQSSDLGKIKEFRKHFK